MQYKYFQPEDCGSEYFRRIGIQFMKCVGLDTVFPNGRIPIRVRFFRRVGPDIILNTEIQTPSKIKPFFNIK